MAMVQFLTVDHIVPSRQGGDDHMDNLRLLCVDCHISLQNMHPGGYHPDTGELSPDYIKNSRRYKRLRENKRTP
jgi:5-methylcytosine-specific restriction endonuclease McrA